MAAIPQSHRDLFDKKSFAHLATVGADGAPQVTPVWIDYDGTHIRFNTARGRVKRNRAQSQQWRCRGRIQTNRTLRPGQGAGTEMPRRRRRHSRAGKKYRQDRSPNRKPGEVR